MASVQVAVRVRPFNEREINSDSKCIIRMESNKTIILNHKTNDSFMNSSSPTEQHLFKNSTTDLSSTSLNSSQANLFSASKEFVYDFSYWSFSPSDPNFKSQQDVFNNLGTTSVKNAFDGYNTCICAYGQTGSGKSYSMMGSASSSEHEGLIPRMCKNLFERMKSNDEKLNSHTATYRVEVSYLEIYNEKVRDLLRSSSKLTSKQLGDQNLRVREHPKTGVYVQDLSQHIVVNYYDIEELLSKGNINRTTASTQMNDTSSRSHAIFTVKFSQVKLVENNIPSETVSKMNLVDLAGSERADSTGATGIRLKEGSNINKSLLTFINVISTLADLAANESNKKHYIPYRDSILTWLLKDSLGGNSKTVILATISPADINYAETLSTLRYANRAKNIINKPTVNEDPNVKLIRELRAEIEQLKLIGRPLLPNFQGHSSSEQINQNETKINELTAELKCKWHAAIEENEAIIIEKICQNANGILIRQEKHPILLNLFENGSATIRLYLLLPGRTLIQTLYPLDDHKNDENNNINETNLIQIETNDNEIIKCSIDRINDNQCFLSVNTGSCQLNDILIEENNDSPHQIEMNHGDLIFFGQNKNSLFLFVSQVDSVKSERKPFSLSSLFKPCEEELNQQKLTINELKKQIQSFYEQIQQNNIEMLKLKEEATIAANDAASAAVATAANSLSIEANSASSSSSFQVNTKQEEETLTISDQQATKQSTQSDNNSMEYIVEEHGLVESFERNEKLLNECIRQLNSKSKQTELKSLVFELQNLRLKDKQLEADAKQTKFEIEALIERLTNKREEKLNELNAKREEILNNRTLTDLKTKMSALTDHEIELDSKLSEIKTRIRTDQEHLDDLNVKLNSKIKFEQFKTVDDLIRAESETIERFRQQIELSRKEKADNYALIESEFEKAKLILANNFNESSEQLVQIKQNIENLSMDESKLKQFLVDCLYENDEEKCLVENELTDIIEEREKLEDLLEELKRNNLMIVEQSMLEEYKGLEALKEQDNSEIKQDDERLQILIESSAKNMLTLIQQKRNEINTDQSQLKILNNELTANSKTLNSLLNELEVLESKRLIEENRLFSSELKMANEFKSENDKLNFKLRKLEENLHKKLSQNVNAKNLIKPRICSLVGVYQGVQLFEADFNSNNPFNSESIGHRSNGSLILSNNETTTSNATNTLNSIDSISPLSSNYNANTINDFNSIIRTVKQKQPIGIKFNGCISKLLGVNINITESVLFSNRNKVIGSDEHYEYLIDIKINNPNQLVEQTEHWCISRRFKRIRSLHDQMCGLFPVLNCLVFPTRLVFNQSEKQLIERQCQLEHYLKCFIEILLNEPTCSIYYLFKNSEIVQSSTCDSLNSNQSSSIGFVDSASSFYTNNNLNYLSKHKLCSFCPFFQQTEFDKAYYMRKFNN